MGQAESSLASVAQEEPVDSAHALAGALATLREATCVVGSQFHTSSALEAAWQVYKLAGQGAHNGDGIREAGGIPVLLAVVAGTADAESLAAELALGTLAHLGMQCTANHEALCAAGGLLILLALLRNHPATQCAQYADSILTVMAMSSQSAHVRQAVTEAAAALPANTLANYPELALFVGRGGHKPNSHPPATSVRQGGTSVRQGGGLSPSLGSAPHCAICLDEIECDQPTQALACGHCYHESCINNWLRHNLTCPTCRQEVRTSDVRDIVQSGPLRTWSTGGAQTGAREIYRFGREW